jgi:LPXTG-motif cell wall-anchored protein
VRRRSLIAGFLACLLGMAAPAALFAQEPAAPEETAVVEETTGEPPAEPAPAPAAEPDPAEAADQTAPSTATRSPKRGTGVSMIETAFVPATISIPVGGTVTWTNNGEEDHTSTAEGLWDSGTLTPGTSFSHTFTTAGTFSYLCTLHDMTGTVLVGDTSTGGGGTGGTGGDGNQPGTTPGATGPGSESAGIESAGAAGSSSRLPTTGDVALPLALAGLALLGVGLLARRWASDHRG